MDLLDVWPPFGVRITCGPVELRTVCDDDIPALAQLAIDGVEAEGLDLMPFIEPWHREDPATLPASMARYYWSTRGSFTPSRWTLMLTVSRDGEVVGVQDLMAREFLKVRSLETGSWLGRAHQRRGTGTLMRQMAAVFCFDHLDAEELTSGYMHGNLASKGVSDKLGYVERYLRRAPREEGWTWSHGLALTPEAFVRPEQPVQVEGVAAFRRFIGLDA